MYCPLVSIIVPVYNASKWLSQCLDSICGQTYRNIEIICVDDGSTDDSLLILQSYCDRDSRITILKQSNKFAGAARNLGMEHASGEYLLFLDADDFFDIHMVEKMVDACTCSQADIAICRAIRYDEFSKELVSASYSLDLSHLGIAIPTSSSLVISQEQISRGLFQFCVGWPWDKLFKASFVRKYGLFFQEQRSTNDAFMVFVALSYASKVAIVDEVLVTHRIGNGESVSNTRDLSVECARNAMLAIRERLIEDGSFQRLERSFVNWQVHFSLWNYNSLTGDAKNEMARIIREEIAAQVNASSRSDGFFTNTGELTQFREITEIFPTWYGIDDLEMLPHRPWIVPEEADDDAARRGIPAVSVIVPIYNVQKYLDQALDSLQVQELSNIEILCIVDGSTDYSLDIALRHAANDPRITVINKPNSGYGASMNVGIKCARGEYIGILEPDDFVLPHMFSSLYSAAKASDAQIVKSDFYRFTGQGDSHERTLCFVGDWDGSNRRFYHRVLRPIDEQEVFMYEMNTWCGIYRRDFLELNHIDHNETPGASFQDNGFWFKGYVLADSVCLLDVPGYMNRRDNPASSVRDRSKSLATRVEYMLIRDFLLERPEVFSKVSSMFWAKYLHNVNATLYRIDVRLRMEVLDLAHEDFSMALDMGELDFFQIADPDADDIRFILEDPTAYHFDRLQLRESQAKAKADREIDRLRQENADLQTQLQALLDSHSFKLGSTLMKLPSAIRRRLRRK